MTCLVLDAGALIALERGDRALWAALKTAADDAGDVIVPTSVIAQVWRAAASQARLALALRHCALAPFDGREREIGELCATTQTRDICDAHVALVAAKHADVLYTSDPDDLRRLLAALGARAPAIVPC